jgi:uncharacterized protein (UPF0332 family)
LSFAWEDYQALSENLVAQPFDGLHEATFRCVVSRAYYGVFREASDWLGAHGRTPDTSWAGSHDQVIYAFARGKGEEAVRLFLLSLKRMRGIADYDRGKTVDQTDANSACLKAKLARKSLRDLV